MNTIFVAASNHAIEEVEPLLESAFRNVPNLRMVLLIYPKDLRRNKNAQIKNRFPKTEFYLAPRIGRRLRPVAQLALRVCSSHALKYEGGLGRWLRGSMHITLERFFSAREFLARDGQGVSNLMIADGRDVLIQSDPFDGCGETIVTGEEGVTMGTCLTNSGWYRDLYGAKEMGKVRKQLVLCSGVTLGSARRMAAYLEAMEREIWARASRIRGRGYFDQAIHNWVLRSGEVDFEASPVSGGLIATLGYPGSSRVAWGPDRKSVLVDETIPPVVHQYDRILKR